MGVQLPQTIHVSSYAKVEMHLHVDAKIMQKEYNTKKSHRFLKKRMRKSFIFQNKSIILHLNSTITNSTFEVGKL